MVRIIGVLSLALLMTACIEEPKNKPDPNPEPSYGVNYPASGQTSEASLDSLAQLQAFAAVFELHHRHQPVFYYWLESTISLTEEDPTQLMGACTGPLSRSIEIEAEDEGEGEGQIAVFNHQLTFNGYCNPNPLWNTHSKEFGSLQVQGVADLYNVEFYSYTINREAYYQVSVGGKLVVSTQSEYPTYTFEHLVIQQDAPSILAKYQDLKISQVGDGDIYTGVLYHPDYGRVQISTGPLEGDRVQTAEDEQPINRPFAGRLRFDASGNRGWVTFLTQDDYRLELDLGTNNVIDQQQDTSW